MVTIYFSVSVPFPISDDQFVFVTGSSKKLGHWKANKALKLKKDKDDRWVGFAYLYEPINFIYFIGHYIKSEKENEKVLAIFQWETLVKPRSLEFSDVFCYRRVKLRDVFGEEGEDLNYNSGGDMNQVALKVPGDSLKLCRKRKLEDYVVERLDLDQEKKKSKSTRMVTGDEHRERLRERDDIIRERDIQINNLQLRVDLLERENRRLERFADRCLDIAEQAMQRLPRQNNPQQPHQNIVANAVAGGQEVNNDAGNVQGNVVVGAAPQRAGGAGYGNPIVGVVAQRNGGGAGYGDPAAAFAARQNIQQHGYGDPVDAVLYAAGYGYGNQLPQQQPLQQPPQNLPQRLPQHLTTFAC
uniref:CBM20 domain-containing protein n=1 Tax=Meloidogyne javanica TaxID=6303 RepID=A0A915LMB5_MELJA